MNSSKRVTSVVTLADAYGKPGEAVGGGSMTLS
jgi:hypothetical protein